MDQRTRFDLFKLHVAFAKTSKSPFTNVRAHPFIIAFIILINNNLVAGPKLRRARMWIVSRWLSAKSHGTPSFRLSTFISLLAGILTHDYMLRRNSGKDRNSF